MYLLSRKRGSRPLSSRDTHRIHETSSSLLLHFTRAMEGSWDTRQDRKTRFAEKRTREGAIELPGRRSYRVAHCRLLNYCQPGLLNEPLLFSPRFICLFDRRKLSEYFLKESLNPCSTVRYFYLRSTPRPLDFPFSTRVSSALQAYADVSNYDGRPAILDICRVFHSNKVDAEEKMIYKYRSCVIQCVRFYNCRRLNHSFNFRERKTGRIK